MKKHRDTYNTMPTKLYMVTIGCYSDYRVCGIYSTKELADEAVKCWTTQYDTAEIEEQVLDELPDHPPGLYPYKVTMAQDGSNKTVRTSISLDLQADSVDKEFKTHNGRYTYVTTGCYCFYMFAEDEVHAVKIANERRVQIIANNQWPLALVAV